MIMNNNKRIIIKLVLLILLQVVLVFDLFATIVELIALITYPGVHSLFWDSLSYFVLIVMVASLVYSIVLSKKKIRNLL